MALFQIFLFNIHTFHKCNNPLKLRVRFYFDLVFLTMFRRAFSFCLPYKNTWNVKMHPKTLYFFMFNREAEWEDERENFEMKPQLFFIFHIMNQLVPLTLGN